MNFQSLPPLLLKMLVGMAILQPTTAQRVTDCEDISADLETENIDPIRGKLKATTIIIHLITEYRNYDIV